MKKNQIERQELKNAKTAFKTSMDEFNNTLKITRENEEDIIQDRVWKKQKEWEEEKKSQKVYVKSVKKREEK